VLGDSSRDGVPARALAVVWFEGPGDRRLRVDVLGAANGAVRSRTIDFREEDLLPDRYRAAGLTVAALADERSSETCPSCRPAPPPRPEEERRPGIQWALGAGGLAGGGLAGGPGRAGGWASVSVSGLRSGLLGTVSASYAAAISPPSPGLSVQWITIAAGVGILAPLPPIHALARARAEAFADWAVVSAHDPGPNTYDRGLVFNPGAGSALELVWPADTQVGLVAGGSASVRAHGTTIRVHGHPTATLPMGSFLGTLGIELRWR
jgi:hypothetical protein